MHRKIRCNRLDGVDRFARHRDIVQQDDHGAANVVVGGFGSSSRHEGLQRNGLSVLPDVEVLFLQSDHWPAFAVGDDDVDVDEVDVLEGPGLLGRGRSVQKRDDSSGDDGASAHHGNTLTYLEPLSTA